MSTVRHDSYMRGTLRRSAEAVSGLHFFLMFVAVGLLVLTRVEHPLVVNLQSLGRELAAPVMSRIATFAGPVRNAAKNTARYFTVESEFRRLERELASLQQLLERTSDLARRNEELARLAKLVKVATVDAKTVEVIAGPKGLFGKAVEIGAGRRVGIRYGQPVFSSDGLVGRITAVAGATSRVLLLNDVNSRIPVEVGANRRPALMVGDITDLPRLVYLSKRKDLKSGDAVMTSGASGEFPRGIAVGTVLLDGDEIRVKTAARLVADRYLTVLLYSLPSPVVTVGPASAKTDREMAGSHAGSSVGERAAREVKQGTGDGSRQEAPR